MLLTRVTVGVGYTVMVKEEVVPVHPLAVGVMVMVAVTIPVVRFTAVKDGISPVPEAARPMEGVLFTQLKVVPATGPSTVMSVEVLLLQTVLLVMVFTVGVGYTVMVKEMEGPGQLLAFGVMVIVATWLVVPVLVAVKLGMSPVPVARSPMDGLSFTHEKVVPATGPVTWTMVVVAPLQ